MTPTPNDHGHPAGGPAGPVMPPAEVQLARSLLAEVADLGCDRFDHGRHLAVLRALDALEDAALVAWVPPAPATGIPGPDSDLDADLDTALARAHTALRAAVSDPDLAGVDVLQVGLAARHIADARTQPPAEHRPPRDRPPGDGPFGDKALGGGREVRGAPRPAGRRAGVAAHPPDPGPGR